jgi:hypothetical protein
MFTVHERSVGSGSARVLCGEGGSQLQRAAHPGRHVRRAAVSLRLGFHPVVRRHKEPRRVNLTKSLGPTHGNNSNLNPQHVLGERPQQLVGRLFRLHFGHWVLQVFRDQ